MKMPSIAAMIVTASVIAAPLLFSEGLAQSADVKVDADAKPPIAAGAPNLVVATVKLDGGWRASKLIGAAVYDDQNQKVGAIDDVVLTGSGSDAHVSVAVIAVGGVLGIGGKLIAVPYDHLRYDPAEKEPKVVFPGATKDSLAAMPGFTYGNG